MMFDVCMTTQYLDSASKLLEHEHKILSKMLNINRRIWGSNFELWQPRVIAMSIQIYTNNSLRTRH